jgi:hypothetical protein
MSKPRTSENRESKRESLSTSSNLRGGFRIAIDSRRDARSSDATPTPPLKRKARQALWLAIALETE